VKGGRGGDIREGRSGDGCAMGSGGDAPGGGGACLHPSRGDGRP